jgi:hypothetical protein
MRVLADLPPGLLPVDLLSVFAGDRGIGQTIGQVDVYGPAGVRVEAANTARGGNG